MKEFISNYLEEINQITNLINQEEIESVANEIFILEVVF